MERKNLAGFSHFVLFTVFLLGSVFGEVRVHHIFGDNMVLQRDKPVRIWGWAERSETVKVSFCNIEKVTKAGSDGTWEVFLPPLKADNKGRKLRVSGPGGDLVFNNVVVGDIWICGGQSNMEDPISGVYHGDAEVASAHFPLIRFFTMPFRPSPEPEKDFQRIDEYNAWTKQTEKKGWWFPCSPETVKKFSAIGYIFGRRLHLATQVPIGLIDASVGGTTAEAHCSRDFLERIPQARALLNQWDKADREKKDSARKIESWKKESEKRKARGLPPLPKPKGVRPQPTYDRNNPGAIFNGMIAPLEGFSVRGAIFNQGFNNALADARPKLYALTFQAVIRSWRKNFRDQELSFGIVELTAGGQPQTLDNFEIRMVDPAPFIREGQLKAFLALPQVGFVCAYDQQVPWYHPHKKVILGERLARWALDTLYGIRLPWRPALLKEWKREGNRILLTFDKPVRTHDGRPFEGFAVADKERRFYPGQAEYLTVFGPKGRKREDRRKLCVYSELVKEPAAVRYAWARNPLGNVVNDAHFERIIPVPCFRTDDWDWPEAGFGREGVMQARKLRAEALRAAREQNRRRRLLEAELLLKNLKPSLEKCGS